MQARKLPAAAVASGREEPRFDILELMCFGYARRRRSWKMESERLKERTGRLQSALLRTVIQIFECYGNEKNSLTECSEKREHLIGDGRQLVGH